jgi:hypothetical protein
VLGITDLWTYVLGTIAIILLPGPNSLFVLGRPHAPAPPARPAPGAGSNNPRPPSANQAFARPPLGALSPSRTPTLSELG